MADCLTCSAIGKCILTQCVMPAITEIVKCILPQAMPAINSHFDYWWCFDNNIQDLKNGIRNLERQKDRMEHKRDEARVEKWLKASTEKLKEAQKISLSDGNIPKECNLISRYSLGKNAKKTAEEIAKLLNDEIFNPRTSTTNFESRKSIEKNIIDSLQKSGVDGIGICGMPGVGKTTMAKRIGERVKEEGLFDEVVMVTVSQSIDMLKIQNEIAECLGLSKFDVESIPARADKLSTRLRDKKRKIIMLDDVWDPSLRFEELGIHIESNLERCKVLLTSRSRDCCNRIKNKVVFDLKILEEEEAWILFKEKAGECVEHSSLRGVPKDVVKECKGLPLALVTVGIALQDETDIHTWRDSLSQLQQNNPTNFPELYQPLKLSYDHLKNDEKNLFLMCCLFPEDHDIPIQQLTWYSFVLRLFDDIKHIEQATNRTYALVGKLKRRFLLIDSYDKRHVKMHDVVRDVAICIGSKEKNGFLKSLPIENSSDVNCNWMSVDISNEQMEVPVLSRFPKLRLLMLRKLSSDQFSDISFEGMTDLNVLSFQNIWIRSLPPTLENLQTLHLFDCEVENISFIGKLTSLKILSCCECYNITELPADIGRLKGLRSLELNKCINLQRIPFGIISSLFLLEELKICNSFSEWETGGERRNASLTELEGLGNLTCLEIEISYCTSSAQEISLSQKLVRYTISITESHCEFEGGDYEKAMNLKLAGAVGNWIKLLARNAEFLILSGDGSDNINIAEMENLRNLKFSNCSTVKKLVDTSYLNQNVSLCNLKSIYISGCSNLKHVFSVSVATTRLLQLELLRIEYCVSMEQVFWNEGRDDKTDGCIELPKLKELRLQRLPNLTAFCQGLENIIIKFPNLTEMWIEKLPKMNVSVATTRLLQLEFLWIEDCAAMEQVLWNEVRDDTYGCIEFPKLKELRLQFLPNLTAFCQGLENIIIKFPNLTKMRIGGLPKLRSLSPLNSETVVCHEEDRFHLFCNSKVEMHSLKTLSLYNMGNNIRNIWCHQFPNNIFNNLETLEIKSMNGIRSLMSTSIAKNLVSLQSLLIENCQEIVEVIEREDDDKQVAESLSLGGDGSDNINIAEMENLRNLQFRDCSTVNKLVDTSYLNQNVSLCNLKSIQITSCPKLRSLFSVSVARTSLLQLEVLQILYCESMEQVFWNEVRDDNRDGCIEFPKLKELLLFNLPNLTAFCQGLENIIIKFPNLIEMKILFLPKLNSLFPLNSETVENTCFHLFCNPKVELGCLKVASLLDLGHNIRNINVFNNLETLCINGMNGIRSLMSTSMAKNLVSLKHLEIKTCEEMVEVIERDDVDKQVVDINRLFPNLIELTMIGLTKLIRFWQWNHALELPLLERVLIIGCPVMETFTLGSVNTPNISVINVNREHIDDQEDLNDVIRHIWTESQDKYKAEEDEYEDENES